MIVGHDSVGVNVEAHLVPVVDWPSMRASHEDPRLIRYTSYLRVVTLWANVKCVVAGRMGLLSARRGRRRHQCV